MRKIDLEEELRVKRLQRWKQYEQYQASVDNASSGNFGSSHIISHQTGQIAGRLVRQIDSGSSKESEILRGYLERNSKNQLHNHCVNTAKESARGQSIS